MSTFFERAFVGLVMGTIGLTFVGYSVIILGFLTFTSVYIPLAILYVIDGNAQVLPELLSTNLERLVLLLIAGAEGKRPAILLPFLLFGSIGTFFMWRKANREIAMDKEKERQEETVALRDEESTYMDLLTRKAPWRPDTEW